MRFDYHMHFEKGSYDTEWAEGFFRAAEERHLDEVGFSDHSHTFPEFKDLYYKDLILDDSFIGQFQKKWLKKNKFKYTLDEYFAFMDKLRARHPGTKTGIEVCNFSDQEAVGKILDKYPFDYRIGSIHFIKGWAYDSEEIESVWHTVDLDDVYSWYADEAIRLIESGNYDVLGHPFNIRVYVHIPEFDATPYIKKVIAAMKRCGTIVDVNTGTLYRYPIKEISPYYKFMRLAAEAHLPIMTSSDEHRPEDCGRENEQAIAYARMYGYKECVHFTGSRKWEMVPLG